MRLIIPERKPPKESEPPLYLLGECDESTLPAMGIVVFRDEQGHRFSLIRPSSQYRWARMSHPLAGSTGVPKDLLSWYPTLHEAVKAAVRLGYSPYLFDSVKDYARQWWRLPGKS